MKKSPWRWVSLGGGSTFGFSECQCPAPIRTRTYTPKRSEFMRHMLQKPSATRRRDRARRQATTSFVRGLLGVPGKGTYHPGLYGIPISALWCPLLHCRKLLSPFSTGLMCLTLTIFVRRPRTVDVGYHMGVVTMPLAVFFSTSTYLMDCLHIHPASAPASAAAFGFLTVPGSLSLPACPKAQSRFISILTSECSVWVMATCSAHALQLFSCDVLSAGSQCHEHYMALYRGSPSLTW